MSVEEPTRCEDCDSPLRAAQRYCVGCGARVGSRSPQLVALLRRKGASSMRATPAPPPPSATGARRARGLGLALASGLRLPSRPISALLVLVFLGFGVLIGAGARPPSEGTLAASRQPLKLLLAPTAPAPSASTPTSPSASAGEPPAVEAESTPTAAAKTPAAAAEAPSSATKAATTPSTADGEGKRSSGSSSPGSTSALPPVKHVFLITLSDQPYAAVFGPSSGAPYLSGTLERRGALLVRYYAVAHQELADAIALVSGQGPSAATAGNCPTYTDIAPGTVGAEQQVSASGCVYPRATETLAGQLSAKHLTWRAYVQGIDEGPGTAGPCAHPALGAADPTAGPPPQRYVNFRDPFVYFHSVIDSKACASADVGLRGLGADLSNPKHTRTVSYIVPDRCHDASPTPCAPGAPSGPAAADGLLSGLVPKILASKAYKDGGLLIITVDQAPSSGEFADSSSCCAQPAFANLPPAVASAGALRHGGGQVGALLLSPFIKPGTTGQEAYNHFSLLRTIEDLFGLKHLGYAARAGVSSLEPALFSAYKRR